jgi:hypothetical protein
MLSCVARSGLRRPGRGFHPQARQSADPGIARAFPQHAHLSYEDRARTFGPARGYYRRGSWDFLREALKQEISPLVRRRFLASRMARSALTGSAAWFEIRRAVFLMQQEELVAASGAEVGAVTRTAGV